jgi:hypothetical protein
VLDKSAKLADFARDNGCTIIHVPISFETGHNEIADKPYGILAGVKAGQAFTSGEWGADFAGTVFSFSALLFLLLSVLIHLFIPYHNIFSTFFFFLRKNDAKGGRFDR